MAPGEFTFVNTTDAPDLSKAAFKRVRGHVTRQVFAVKRVRRLAAKAKAETQDYDKRRNIIATIEPQDGANAKSSLVPRASGVENSSQQSPHLGRSVCAALHGPLETSMEPVLTGCLGSMAAHRYLPPWPTGSVQSSWPETHPTRSAAAAGAFAQMALSTSSYTFGVQSCTYSDELLGSILAMAFGERLLFRDGAWNVHMSRVSHILAARRSTGVKALPAIVLNGVAL